MAAAGRRPKYAAAPEVIFRAFRDAHDAAEQLYGTKSEPDIFIFVDKMSYWSHYGKMGRVDAFTIAGLDLWFNSADHRPPHFHAEKSGDWEVRVFFLRRPSAMIEEKWSRRRLRSADLRALVQMADRHRGSLYREWENKVHVQAPGGLR